MKRVVAAGQMKYLDSRTIEYHHVPSLVLMERAALVVVKHLLDFDLKKVLVLCGSGNNGGDGIAVARILHLKGYDVSYFFMGNEEKMSDGCRQQMDIAKSYGVKHVNNPVVSEYTTIVDALFGVGLSRNLAGVYESIVLNVNQSDVSVVAVDMPSGISSDTGAVLGCAINADLTVTFAFAKIGQLLYPGKSYCGRLEVEDIGIYGTENCFDDDYYYLEPSDLLLVPKRSPYGNKGTFGKVLLISGSPDMPGASVLCGQAIMRTGAGMVRIVAPKENKEILASAIPEAILDLYEDEKVLNKIDDAMNWADVIVMGPGLGRSELAQMIVLHTMKICNKPMIIDADGLNILSEHMDLLYKKSCPCIVTPHIGEMARLCKCSSKDVSANILHTSKMFAEKYYVQCVLKDAVTCIALPNSRVYLNNTGNAGMATAGSGDVLAGIIGGLLALGTSYEHAGALACWIHGTCGDKIKERLSEGYLMAGDLVRELSSFRIGEE